MCPRPRPDDATPTRVADPSSHRYCARVDGNSATTANPRKDDTMADLTDTRVLILAADLFEDMELLYPLYRLREEHVGTTLASVGGAPVTGKKGHGPVEAEADIADMTATAFDALVIPGGFAPDKLRRDQHVLDLVRAFDDAGKPIAFICHAGWVPISAGIVKGRRATSVGAIRDDMVNAGVDWVDEETVVDGNLISARDPGDLGPWMRALLDALRAA
jgi:protease I